MLTPGLGFWFDVKPARSRVSACPTGKIKAEVPSLRSLLLVNLLAPNPYLLKVILGESDILCFGPDSPGVMIPLLEASRLAIDSTKCRRIVRNCPL